MSTKVKEFLSPALVEYGHRGKLYQELSRSETFDFVQEVAAYLGPRMEADLLFTENVAVRRNKGWLGTLGHVSLVAGQSVAHTFDPGYKPSLSMYMGQSSPYAYRTLPIPQTLPPKAAGVVLTETGELEQYSVVWAKQKTKDGVLVVTGPSDPGDSVVVKYADQEQTPHPHAILEGLVAVAHSVYRPDWGDIVPRPDAGQLQK
jgi:hypothetical protein